MLHLGLNNTKEDKNMNPDIENVAKSVTHEITLTTTDKKTIASPNSVLAVIDSIFENVPDVTHVTGKQLEKTDEQVVMNLVVEGRFDLDVLETFMATR